MNQKKLQILQAAKELFFKNGFSDTSVTDIIALANVSKGTFYNHFSSKSECMIAIFHDIHERSVAEREIIANFNNKFDIATLEKELVTHFTIIIESSIMDIMTNNISSKDHQDIFNLIKSRSLYEIQWLGNRLIEVYGPYIKNNAYEFAAMILGSIQQIALIRTIMIPSNILIDEVIGEILKKFEPGIFAAHTNNTTLLPEELFVCKHTVKDDEKKLSVEELIEEIEVFYNENYLLFNEENKEYTKFLIETLKISPEKKAIIKTLAYSFVNSFKETSVYIKALGIFQEVKASLFS
ncbi:MAG: TetR/AcrR family transcriptional regulator [Solibacillus sp.]